jgi:hypothetical protein
MAISSEIIALLLFSPDRTAGGTWRCGDRIALKCFSGRIEAMPTLAREVIELFGALRRWGGFTLGLTRGQSTAGAVIPSSSPIGAIILPRGAGQ